MTTTLSLTAANPHIAALEPILGQATIPIQWLLIAHNDSRLLNVLSPALPTQSAAVLPVSQDLWDFQAPDLAETIEWALHQSDIRHLVLVGSSQAEHALSGASMITATPSYRTDTAHGKLLAGMQRYNARSRETQASFAGHVEQMWQLPAVHSRWCAGELAVYGLFYRAESGLFLTYDLETRDFRPLWP